MSDKQPRGFARAVRRAREMLDRKQDLMVLLDKARDKAEEKKGALGETWEDLKVFFALVRDWSRGDYKGISVPNLLVVVGAIIYFVNPFDAIPDFIIGYGFLDDITVIGYVFNSMRKEIQAYRDWLTADSGEPAGHVANSQGESSSGSDAE